MDTVAEHLVNMGEARLGKLINLLLQNNRIEDVKRLLLIKKPERNFTKNLELLINEEGRFARTVPLKNIKLKI